MQHYSKATPLYSQLDPKKGNFDQFYMLRSNLHAHFAENTFCTLWNNALHFVDKLKRAILSSQGQIREGELGGCTPPSRPQIWVCLQAFDYIVSCSPPPPSPWLLQQQTADQSVCYALVLMKRQVFNFMGVVIFLRAHIVQPPPSKIPGSTLASSALCGDHLPHYAESTSHTLRRPHSTLVEPPSALCRDHMLCNFTKTTFVEYTPCKLRLVAKQIKHIQVPCQLADIQ